jgi:hypothetical protein
VVADTHYATLGVTEGAEPDAVRRAYLDMARQLHPDRWIDASPDERIDVERRMQAVNEAWRILGNPARRLAYDVERREVGRRARVAPPTGVGDRYAFATGDLFTEDVPPIDLLTRVLRALPWIIVFVALAGIFVFTAYATSDTGTRPAGEGDRCILKVDGSAVDTDCAAADARRVVIAVAQVGQCPFDTEPFQPADSPQEALCLDPPG